MNGLSSIKSSLQGVQNLNIRGDVTANTFELSTKGTYLSNINSNVQTQIDNVKNQVTTLATTNIGSISTTTYVNPLTVSIDSNNFNYSGTAWNSGIYNFSSSSLSTLSASFKTYNAFNGYSGVDTCWVSASNVYATVGGLYTGSVTTLGLNLTTGVSSYFNGEWLQIQLPIKIVLTSYKILPKYTNGNLSCPNYWSILGSNNGSDWIVLDTKTNNWVAFSVLTTFVPTNISYNYSYFRIVFHTVQTNAVTLASYVGITQWDLGTNLLFNFINNSVGATGPTGPQGSSGDVTQLRQIATQAGIESAIAAGSAAAISSAAAVTSGASAASAVSSAISAAGSALSAGTSAAAAGLSAFEAGASANLASGYSTSAAESARQARNATVGATGPKGDNGDDGAPGADGATGPIGPTGPSMFRYVDTENVYPAIFADDKNFIVKQGNNFLFDVNGVDSEVTVTCKAFEALKLNVPNSSFFTNLDRFEVVSLARITFTTDNKFDITSTDYKLETTTAKLDCHDYTINAINVIESLSSKTTTCNTSYTITTPILTITSPRLTITDPILIDTTNYTHETDTISLTCLTSYLCVSPLLRLTSDSEIRLTCLNPVDRDGIISITSDNFVMNSNNFTINTTNNINIHSYDVANADTTISIEAPKTLINCSDYFILNSTNTVGVYTNFIDVTCDNFTMNATNDININSYDAGNPETTITIAAPHGLINCSDNFILNSTNSIDLNTNIIGLNGAQVGITSTDGTDITSQLYVNMTAMNDHQDGGTMTLLSNAMYLQSNFPATLGTKYSGINIQSGAVNVASSDDNLSFLRVYNPQVRNINDNGGITMQFKANRSNIGNYIDGVITVVAPLDNNAISNQGQMTLKSGTVKLVGPNGIIIVTNSANIPIIMHQSTTLHSYYSMNNSFANLLTMKFKALDTNLVNTTDATITVTNPNGDNALDNTGNFTFTSGISYLQNTYTYLCSNVTNTSFFSFFNDLINHKLYTNFKSNLALNTSAYDCQIAVTPNSNNVYSNINGAGAMSLVSKIFQFTSTTGRSFINLINGFANNIQISFKANEGGNNNAIPDALFNVSNQFADSFLQGKSSLYTMFFDAACYGNQISYISGNYLMSSLSYVRLFNNCITNIANQVGIQFKADSTNVNNISDASIVCSSTARSIANPYLNGFGKLASYADTIEIGTSSLSYGAGATSITIGNTACNVNILGKVFLQSTDENGNVSRAPLVQQFRVRF